MFLDNADSPPTGTSPSGGDHSPEKLIVVFCPSGHITDESNGGQITVQWQLGTHWL